MNASKDEVLMAVFDALIADAGVGAQRASRVNQFGETYYLTGRGVLKREKDSDAPDGELMPYKGYMRLSLATPGNARPEVMLSSGSVPFNAFAPDMRFLPVPTVTGGSTGPGLWLLDKDGNLRQCLAYPDDPAFQDLSMITQSVPESAMKVLARYDQDPADLHPTIMRSRLRDALAFTLRGDTAFIYMLAEKEKEPLERVICPGGEYIAMGKRGGLYTKMKYKKENNQMKYNLPTIKKAKEPDTVNMTDAIDEAMKADAESAEVAPAPEVNEASAPAQVKAKPADKPKAKPVQAPAPEPAPAPAPEPVPEPEPEPETEPAPAPEPEPVSEPASEPAPAKSDKRKVKPLDFDAAIAFLSGDQDKNKSYAEARACVRKSRDLIMSAVRFMANTALAKLDEAEKAEAVVETLKGLIK